MVHDVPDCGPEGHLARLTERLHHLDLSPVKPHIPSNGAVAIYGRAAGLDVVVFVVGHAICSRQRLGLVKKCGRFSGCTAGSSTVGSIRTRVSP